MAEGEPRMDATVRKGLRILVDSIDIDSIPGLELTSTGYAAVRQALDYMGYNAYQGELVGLYAAGANYDPYGAW